MVGKTDHLLLASACPAETAGWQTERKKRRKKKKNKRIKMLRASLNDAVMAFRRGRSDSQTNVITVLQRALMSWEMDLSCTPTAAAEM